MKYLLTILANTAFNVGNYYLWTSLAFLERGYMAVGSEWLGIIGLFFLGLYISIKILTWEERDGRHNRKSHVRQIGESGKRIF